MPGDNYKGLEDVRGVVLVAIRVVDGVRAFEDDDSAGKIMINPNDFGIPVFKSNRNGNCSRKSSSADCQNLRFLLSKARMCTSQSSNSLIFLLGKPLDSFINMTRRLIACLLEIQSHCKSLTGPFTFLRQPMIL